MFEINLSVPQHDNLVDINTTHHRGLTPEELAEQCVSKIISISETAPHGIQEQHRALQESRHWISCNGSSYRFYNACIDNDAG